MKIAKLTAAALIIAATAGSAFAQGPTGSSADYGNAVASANADRKIDLQSGVHNVTVTNGDTVEFTNGSDSVIWHFDTFPGQTVVDLSAIAPKLNAQGVRVFVRENPLYQG